MGEGDGVVHRGATIIALHRRAALAAAADGQGAVDILVVDIDAVASIVKRRVAQDRVVAGAGGDEIARAFAAWRDASCQASELRNHPGQGVEGVIDGRRYAFIGLERMGGFLVYDITDVNAPVYVSYTNSRDVSADMETENGALVAGDLGPESIVFIPADKSPVTGVALLAVGNEVSGSTTLYRLVLE